MKWLASTDPLINQIAARAKHEAHTGNWFIQGSECQEWRDTPNSFLWLHGIPGCGKSVLWYGHALTREESLLTKQT